jgi:hypothetical protein
MSTALASSSPRARVTPPLPAVRAILRVDGLRLVRDRFLIGTVVYIIAVSVAMRWIIPFATNQLAVRLGFDLTPYHGLITSHFVVQLAAMVGGVAGGFLILESKENRVIAAFRVTPVSFASYVAILGLVLVAATELIAVVEALIVGIGTPPLVPLALTALAGAPASPPRPRRLRTSSSSGSRRCCPPRRTSWRSPGSTRWPSTRPIGRRRRTGWRSKGAPFGPS